MSYILDALKKSEQQRQEIEPNTVSDRLLVNTAEEKTKTRKWWLVLIAVNLLVTGGLLWYLAQYKAGRFDAKPPVSRLPANPGAAPTVLPIDPPPAESISATEPQPTEAEAPSIADMMAVEPASIADKAMPRKTKPIQDKKPVPLAKKRSPEYSGQRTPPEYQPEPDWQAFQQSAPVESAPPKYEPLNPQPEEARGGDAGQSRPKLAINVFGYAQKPEERFVIINMKKYKVGERINDGLQLRAIHPDHIELQQGGVTFKMNRP